jgi:hypothetical protein
LDTQINELIQNAAEKMTSILDYAPNFAVTLSLGDDKTYVNDLKAIHQIKCLDEANNKNKLYWCLLDKLSFLIPAILDKKVLNVIISNQMKMSLSALLLKIKAYIPTMNFFGSNDEKCYVRLKAENDDLCTELKGQWPYYFWDDKTSQSNLLKEIKGSEGDWDKTKLAVQTSKVKKCCGEHKKCPTTDETCEVLCTSFFAQWKSLIKRVRDERESRKIAEEEEDERSQTQAQSICFFLKDDYDPPEVPFLRLSLSLSSLTNDLYNCYHQEAFCTTSEEKYEIPKGLKRQIKRESESFKKDPFKKIANCIFKKKKSDATKKDRNNENKMCFEKKRKGLGKSIGEHGLPVLFWAMYECDKNINENDDRFTINYFSQLVKCVYKEEYLHAHTEEKSRKYY